MRNQNTVYMKAFWAAAVAIVLFSCSVMQSKKPVKNTGPVQPGTTWEYVEKMFVADAGTMTITHTLEFTTDKDVKVSWKSYMPAHPAMYMNRDGSVDTIPASGNESVDEGTYAVGKDKVTITLKDGTVQEYQLIEGDMLVFDGRLGKEVYSKK